MRGNQWSVLMMVAILSLVVAACGPTPTAQPTEVVQVPTVDDD